ncbi:unnamed protein product [Cuscuta epithymum]|uniref:Transposase, Ptta/En/Spm, plant n=1 Tax=Cuscuta epithymum TaxID=186058 RepID=A0AAV0DCM0_9ASTE|nr:unnamed protein product [Cuscuta epithymum]
MSASRGSFSSFNSGRGRGRGRGAATQNSGQNSHVNESVESVHSRNSGAEQDTGFTYEPEQSQPKIWIRPSQIRSNPTVLDAIIDTITSNYHGPWHSFKHAESKNSNRWWRLFEQKYRWEPHHGAAIKKKFGSRGSEWFSKNIGRARRENTKPNWVAERDWLVLKEYWASDAFKKKSIAGKKNRNTDAAKESQYRGGRIPVTAHVAKMTESLNRPPLKIEVYEKVYVPKNGDLPARVVETRNKYNEMKAVAESKGKSYDKDDSELFCKVVPKYRGRRYGTGSEAESLESVDGPSRVCGTTQEEIDQRIREEVEARFAQHKQQVQAQMAAQMASMSGAFMAYMEQVRSSNPSIPLPDFSGFRTPTLVPTNGFNGDSNFLVFL